LRIKRSDALARLSSTSCAGDLLDALAAIRDYCSAYVKERKGKFSDFKRAWVDMVVEHLDDARLRERRLYTGITGKADDESQAVTLRSAPALG
jgi:hypothetical protein